MATRRIKDITNTATTFASDDFIALDGATQGTRKMDKDDLIAEVSAGVSGDYLEEANNLSDVASLDTSKLNMEIPDVGTAPNEVPLNGMLGSMAYQSAEGISVAKLQGENAGLNASPTDARLTIADSTNDCIHLTADESTIQGPYADTQIRMGGNITVKGVNNAFLVTGSNAGLAVDSSGRVGIGTASPGSFALGANELVVGDGAAGRGITVYGSPSTGGSLYFADGTSGTAKERGFIYYNHAADEMRFGTAADTRWTINSTGNLVAGANLGIDFGSGASTTLDAYEEGVHTTAATPSSSGTITLDASSNSLSYTRVGRKVTVSGALGVSAVSSPVGNYINFTLPLQIADLDELSGHFAGSCVVLNAAGSMGSYSIIALDGESSFRLYKNTSTSAVATAQDFSGDETIYVSVTYFTTA